MRHAHLVVATILLVTPLVLAQHHESSTPSTGSSSSASYGSSSGTSSSSTYSGGSSSSSSSHSSSSSSSGSSYGSSSGSTSSHSSGSSSSYDSGRSAGHSSGSSSSYNSGNSASHGSNDSRSVHSGAEPSRPDHGRTFRDQPRESGKSNLSSGGASASSGARLSSSERTIRGPKSNAERTKTDSSAKSEAKPERRHFFLFWRHPKPKEPTPPPIVKVLPPFRCKKGEDCTVKPPIEAKVQPPERCKKGEVCPPPCPVGSYRSDMGVCVPVPEMLENQCPSGGVWNGTHCVETTLCPAGEVWNGMMCVASATSGNRCAAYWGRAGLLANELRGIKAQMQTACSPNSTGQQCGELTQQHDGALLRYRMLLNEAPAECQATMPDPLSL